MNVIAPGSMLTDMFEANRWHYALRGISDMGSDVTSKGLAGLCPLRTVGVPKDVARVMAWLAGDDSELVNGRVLELTGDFLCLSPIMKRRVQRLLRWRLPGRL